MGARVLQRVERRDDNQTSGSLMGFFACMSGVIGRHDNQKKKKGKKKRSGGHRLPDHVS